MEENKTFFMGNMCVEGMCTHKDFERFCDYYRQFGVDKHCICKGTGGECFSKKANEQEGLFKLKKEV